MTDARAALVEKVAKDRYEEKRARLLEVFGNTAGWPEWENLRQALKDIEIETYAPVIDLVLEEAARVAEEYGEFDRKLIASADDDEERAAFERGAFKAANIASTIRALKSGK